MVGIGLHTLTEKETLSIYHIIEMFRHTLKKNKKGSGTGNGAGKVKNKMNEKKNCNAVIIGEARKKALKTYCQMHEIYFEISDYSALTKEHAYYFAMVCEKKQILELSEFIENLYK